MKTCHCCSNTASNIINLPYYDFNLCDFCTNTYYKFIDVINNLDI